MKRRKTLPRNFVCTEYDEGRNEGFYKKNAQQTHYIYEYSWKIFFVIKKI